MTRTLLYAFISLFIVMVFPDLTIHSQGVKATAIDWVRGPDMPQPRGGYFAAWYQNGLWIAGGSYWKDGEKLWTDETSFYDPKSKAWSTLKPIPRRIGYG